MNKFKSIAIYLILLKQLKCNISKSYFKSLYNSLKYNNNKLANIDKFLKYPFEMWIETWAKNVKQKDQNAKQQKLIFARNIKSWISISDDEIQCFSYKLSV